MSSRTLKSLTVALASAATVMLAATSSSAAGLPWFASHGTATADGSRSLERGSGILSSTLVVQGELKNAGPGCYSLCFKTHYAPTTTASVYVCKDEGAGDCGQQMSLTTWPVKQTAPSTAAAEWQGAPRKP
ncbi:hypothetical protein [Streptomyces virginiae]|uniref:hypothetical protein n=1 Tax=Streptomyces virginiae TaxID=1961 RepID=UPI00225425AD|nr:hypothetical protein [Streptomyces virginiae]MCX4959571.1 hypothetical protein [Streptomyces virginiae]